MSRQTGFIIRDLIDNKFYRRGDGWTEIGLFATTYATEEAAATIARQFGKTFVVDAIVADVAIVAPIVAAGSNNDRGDLVGSKTQEVTVAKLSELVGKIGDKVDYLVDYINKLEGRLYHTESDIRKLHATTYEIARGFVPHR